MRNLSTVLSALSALSTVVLLTSPLAANGATFGPRHIFPLRIAHSPLPNSTIFILKTSRTARSTRRALWHRPEWCYHPVL